MQPKHATRKQKLHLLQCFLFSLVATAGQTEWRWWRATSRRLWGASRWSCSPKRSPPLMITSWSSGSAPTPATRGSLSSGSTGFSAAFPDTHKKTWIMHKTAQVAAFFCSFLPSACLSELFRCMPQSEDDTETPQTGTGSLIMEGSASG